ncbi:MAG: hypothetical protein J07HQX50_01116 [Haloquadratum sp. J07HQX50]|nr:MAG: hypothetical protein J07HQX50_01116 [Haloquadratum sp. J07HQX50]
MFGRCQPRDGVLVISKVFDSRMKTVEIEARESLDFIARNRLRRPCSGADVRRYYMECER